MKRKRLLTGVIALALAFSMVFPAAAIDGDAPDYPTATVTEVAEPQKNVPIYDTSYNQTGETADVDAEYVFAAVEPTTERSLRRLQSRFQVSGRRRLRAGVSARVPRT